MPDDQDDGQTGSTGDAGQPPPPEGDPMGPPAEPCECWCLHCNRTFMSDRMWFQRVIGDPDGFAGFWMCPTPNCGGAGFTFDIFPTDPDHPANEGWHSFDEEGEPDGEDAEFLDTDADADPDDADWDPDERKWRALDDELGDSDDDDVEGEEWKAGLSPGERPPPPPPPPREPTFGSDDARAEWEAEQRSYDEPDRRPRELDWGDRQSRRRPPPDGEAGGEDEIPF